ncbi:MAG: hypothetical protein JSV63_03070 [Candidatus Aenigmatarchaeota archaeon]|nr:MAG: hypothetical protein JSV63_03070 [Candidatus Aenigmarchaeota archaeon]
MRYRGYLVLVFITLIASVLIENRNLFSTTFFTIGYITMSVVLVIGSKYRENYKVDAVIGTLLIFSVGFLSTQTFIYMFTNKLSEVTLFKLEVILVLDYCALGFLKESIERRKARKTEKIIATIASKKKKKPREGPKVPQWLKKK